MSTEESKAVARRYVDEYLNQAKGVGGEDLFAPTYRSHFPGSSDPLDRKEHDHAIRLLVAAFPDARVTVEVMIAGGDRVVSRYTFRGTHQGIPPSGKQVTIGLIDIFRIADSRIVEQWSEFDTLGVLQQIGGFPSPGQ
jgi:predicted ester cyclase